MLSLLALAVVCNAVVLARAGDRRVLRLPSSSPALSWGGRGRPSRCACEHRVVC